MPLTALDSDSNLLDITTITEDAWSSLRRARPRAILSCRGCGWRVHPKDSSRSLHFFAHNPTHPPDERPDCKWIGETPEHLRLKRHLAEAARAAGWTAEIEALPGPGDVGRWRADVLAVAPNGTRRIALEAQQSPMSPGVGKERTECYERDGIESLWVTLRDPRWVWKVASCKTVLGDAGADGTGGSLLVTRGYATFKGSLRWVPTTVALDALLAALFGGAAIRHVVHKLTEDVPYGDGERTNWLTDAVAIVPLGDLAREQEAQESEERDTRRRAEMAETDTRERERARQEQLRQRHGRQRKALPKAVRYAQQLMRPGESVWLGAQPERLTSASQLAVDGPLGNSSTALGIPILVGPEPERLRLVAVVGPVGNRISSGLRAYWKHGGIEVFASDAMEAERLAGWLRWRVDAIRVADEDANVAPSGAPGGCPA